MEPVIKVTIRTLEAVGPDPESGPGDSWVVFLPVHTLVNVISAKPFGRVEFKANGLKYSADYEEFFASTLDAPARSI